MKKIISGEGWRTKMVYETETQCEKCGQRLIAWKKYSNLRSFCEHCKSEEMKVKEEEQRENWTTEAIRLKAINRMKGSSLVKDKILWDSNLKDYKTVDEETQKALEIAYKAVSGILEGEPLHAIFSGVAGAGKTTLSIGIALEVILLDPNKNCMVLDYQYYLEELRASYSNTNLSNIMKKIKRDACKADVLVIDDIGAETTSAENNRQKASDFTVKELNSILQARGNKPTIITTNLNGSQIRQAYGERIISRLFTHSKGYTMAFNNTKDKRIYPIK